MNRRSGNSGADGLMERSRSIQDEQIFDRGWCWGYRIGIGLMIAFTWCGGPREARHWNTYLGVILLALMWRPVLDWFENWPDKIESLFRRSTETRYPKVPE